MGGVEYASEYGSIQLRQVSHHSYQHHKNISPYGAFSPLQDIIFSADNRSVSMRCAAGLAASSRARTCSGVIVPPFWPAPLPMTALLLGHRPFFCTLSGGAYSRRGSARGPPPHNTDAAKNTKPATYVKHTLDVVKPRDEEQYDSVQIKAIYTTAKGG